MESSLKMGCLGARGNVTPQARLLHYLGRGRVHPSLILVGSSSETRLAISKGIAKFLLCPIHKHGSYCEVCNTCRRVDKNSHPDCLFILEPDEDSLKIETIRQTAHQMSLTPVEGKVKVCVVSDAHRMNSAAANAFLKTLEEPGEGRHFVLLTDQPNSLLPTILSRCIQFRLIPDSDLPMSEEEKKKVEKVWQDYQKTGDLPAIVDAMETKEECEHLLQYMQWQLRESALTLTTPAESLATVNRYEEVVKLEHRLRSNANYALMLESLLRRYF